MSFMTHLWVSPRGRHTTVSNHTASVAKMFGTALPAEDDPAFKAEENRLYAMAYGNNLMRVLADHSRRTMYVDNLVTGDHYRWIAREGARGHYLVLDTDGKEIADFGPRKRKKKRQQEAIDPKEFINQMSDYSAAMERQGFKRSMNPHVEEYQKQKKFGIVAVYVNEKEPDKEWEVAIGIRIPDPTNLKHGGHLLQYVVYVPFIMLEPAVQRVEEIAETESDHEMMEHKLRAIRNEYEPGLDEIDHPVQERLARRVCLGAGVETYIREALDIRNFILEQPVFHIFQSGDRWAVSVREPVPKDADTLSKKAGYWNRILAYIKPYGSSEDGMNAEGWELASITDGALMRNSQMTIWDQKWPTKEAAAEDIWKARQQVKAETATESVKDWIMSLKEPRARDIEYQVFSKHGDRVAHYKRHPLAANPNKFASTGTGFKTLDDAFVYAHTQNVNFDKTGFIRKVHVPSGHVLMTWKMTESGGLLPIEEALDVRQWTLANAGQMIYYVTEYIKNDGVAHATRPLRMGYETEILDDEAKAKRIAVFMAEKAARIPNHEVVRVELEQWDVPSGSAAPRLLHTYWVKADGTIEETTGPADPARAVVAGRGD